MAVYDKDVSWQVNINRGKHERRFIKNFPKDKYTREEVLEHERNARMDLCKPSTPSRNTVNDVALLYLAHIDNCESDKTIKDKKKMLFAHVLPFFGNMSIDSIPGPIFDKYIKQRRGEIKSKSAKKGGRRAINLELLCLSAMSKWACGKSVGMASEPLKVPQLKYRRPVPKIWTREELALLWKSFEPEYRTRYVCLYNAGVRTDELIKLSWPDIDWGGLCLHVLGKGNKQRIVPMNIPLFFAMWSHAEILRHPMLVFPSRRGGKLTDIRKPLLTAVRRSGIKKRIYPHLLRHCFGSHTLQAGGDLRTLQDAMGHEQISTTQIYTHTIMDQMRKLVQGIE